MLNGVLACTMALSMGSVVGASEVQLDDTYTGNYASGSNYFNNFSSLLVDSEVEVNRAYQGLTDIELTDDQLTSIFTVYTTSENGDRTLGAENIHYTVNELGRSITGSSYVLTAVIDTSENEVTNRANPAYDFDKSNTASLGAKIEVTLYYNRDLLGKQTMYRLNVKYSSTNTNVVFEDKSIALSASSGIIPLASNLSYFRDVPVENPYDEAAYLSGYNMTGLIKGKARNGSTWEWLTVNINVSVLP